MGTATHAIPQKGHALVPISGPCWPQESNNFKVHTLRTRTGNHEVRQLMQTVDALHSSKTRVLVVHPQDVQLVSISPMPLKADRRIRRFRRFQPIGEGIG